MIDTHSHLSFKAFNNDYAEVIRRSFDNGIQAIINVGAKLDTSQRAIELAHEFQPKADPPLAEIQEQKYIYAAVGLHPIHTEDEEFDIDNYRKLVDDPKVVAIGETGLDYFHTSDLDTWQKQKQIFQQFLNLSQEKNLPLILHCRGSKNNSSDAYRDMLKIFNSQPTTHNSQLQGVIHCFTSTPEIAQEFLNLGFYIGFTGVITFADELAIMVKSVPLEKILLETDCPYMSPEPYRGQRCEPWYVKFTAQKIAEIKGVELKQVLKQTTQNAKNLFGI